MCGIAGFVDHRLGADEAVTLLERMLERIAHRGPDARGTHFDGPVALGHNRLSIIDLSADGNQPMFHHGAWIVFNGEIYNYVEIRSELRNAGHVFTTESDTEVILAAYKQYGQQCVDHFVGMWSFAIWDQQEKLLFCSRDRFGIKPFHYIFDSGRFYFGSEYKALRDSPLFNNEPNWHQVSRGLQLGWNTYHDETYFEAIKSLPAGHNLLLSSGNLKIYRYWDLSDRPAFNGTAGEKSEKFRDMFLDSIRIHMRSDVEVGVCLSGGLDSSSIASAVSEMFPAKRPKTFTIYYSGKNEVDERPWVNEVLKKYPSLEPYYHSPSDDEIAEQFERAMYFADVPVAGSSPISQYFVMRLAAKNGMKVLLDGQGSDEYLGGYMHSFYRLIGGLMAGMNVQRAMKELNSHAAMQEMSASKKHDVLLKSIMAGFLSEQRLYSLEYRKFFPFVGPDQPTPFSLKSNQHSSLKNFLYNLLFTTSLPTLLQFEDRNSMAFSIESRVPFLDHRLVEFAFSCGDEDLISAGVTKKMLRSGMNGILPDSIVARKDKKGFVTPGEVKWLRGPLKHLIESDFSLLRGMKKGVIDNVISDFKKGDNRYANLVWRLAVLNYWIRRNA